MNQAMVGDNTKNSRISKQRFLICRRKTQDTGQHYISVINVKRYKRNLKGENIGVKETLNIKNVIENAIGNKDFFFFKIYFKSFNFFL